ncbi:MAG: hypothetical protein M3019_02200 [Candidatus Dormibacteraeota bacterium]|nr:hypothetical protein [Candidatus Dormibacteraeota bacterium]
MNRPRRLGAVRVVVLVSAVAASLLSGSVRASAKTLDVCAAGCPYSQIEPAVAAATSGDTIEIGRGTYTGGFVITVSVALVGQGPDSTIIRGGGSVITIGTFGASIEPSVVIKGVRITGGVARSSPESTPFVGQDGALAMGGGIEIPPNAAFTGGATVTISNSEITGNRVAPTRTVPSGLPCPSGQCPFALAAGGGIDNWGTLTLTQTTVSDNRVGSASGLSTLASDANGAGIMNHLNTLTLNDSHVSDNRASATAPNGRFADSGGIFVEKGALTMTDSWVTGNSAILAASFPNSVDLLAIAGGIHIGGTASATIKRSTISDNSVSMTNSVGNATAVSGGIHTDVDVRVTDAVISNNSVRSATLVGSSGDAEGDSGGGEISGTISDTRYADNTVTVSSAAGQAVALAGAAIIGGSMTNSIVSSNGVHGSSPNGSVFVAGGGLVVAVNLELRNTTVTDNNGQARGLAGRAEGGGIFDSMAPTGPPEGPLTLTASAVTRNELGGSEGLMLRGGGVFTTSPVTQAHSVIAHNSPDQCYGC